MSMISLFILRSKEPGLKRPFRSPFYPVFPAIALFLCLVCLFAIIYYNVMLTGVFFVGMAIAVLLFVLSGKHKEKINDDILLERAVIPVSAK
jgi:ethanolamine permease